MTEDYKKQLLNYVIGNLNIEQSKNNDFNIKSIINTNYNGNVWQPYIQQLLSLGDGIVINGILQNEKYNTFISYGAYRSNDKSYGFLIYFNENYEPIDLITKTSTGTLLRGILYLDYDSENNRVFGITSDRATFNTSATSENYFVYFTNLFIKLNNQYNIAQTYSYKIENISGRRIMQILKEPENSNYLIACCNYASTNNPMIIELKINVGTSNELKIWQLTNSYFIYGVNLRYENNEPLFCAICYDGSSFVKCINLDSNINYTVLSSDSTINSNITFFAQPNYISINENNIYFVYTQQIGNNETINYKTILYKYNGISINKIYETENVSVPLDVIKDVPYLNIIIDSDNSIYLIKYLTNETNNTTDIKLLNLSKNSIIEDDDWYFIGTYPNIYRNNIFNQKTVLIRNYNICNIFIFSGYFTESLGTTTNINGMQVNIINLSPINSYTGESYIDANSFIPLYVNLYSNGSLVFSRNLYNISKQNNMIMSSVEIPNNYLNDSEITQNNLISETSFQLNSKLQNWSKNIYEVVDLNFLNTISVIDEDTNTSYLNSAIKINNSINNGTLIDYQNTICNKIRINYIDDTSEIKDIYWNDIDENNKITSFLIYVKKAILSIDFISNDETTIYLTKKIEIEVGKSYMVSQKIRIGDKVKSSELQYNDESIYYDNNQIFIFTKE